MKKIFSKDKILKRNPKIDKKLIERNEQLEKELITLGVKTQPKYTLSHPFDSSTTTFFNQ